MMLLHAPLAETAAFEVVQRPGVPLAGASVCVRCRAGRIGAALRSGDIASLRTAQHAATLVAYARFDAQKAAQSSLTDSIASLTATGDSAPRQLHTSQQPAVTRDVMQQRVAAFAAEAAQLEHKLEKLEQRKAAIKARLDEALSAHNAQLPPEEVDSYKGDAAGGGSGAAACPILWLRRPGLSLLLRRRRE